VSSAGGAKAEPSDAAVQTKVEGTASEILSELASVNRLLFAFAAYAALGVLAYKTLPDERIRLVTFAILGLFAVRTWLRRRDLTHRSNSDDGLK
jgi:hypothetical protein